MTKLKETPAYIKNLVMPIASKTRGRRVWSIDLESVWIPFFTATNAMQDTAVPVDALGLPLRLGYAKDGSVKFTPSGRPQIRVAKPISEAVAMVRENFTAHLITYADKVATDHQEAYSRQIELGQKAGKPIAEADSRKLNEAIQAQLEAMTEAEAPEAETQEAVAPEAETQEAVAVS